MPRPLPLLLVGMLGFCFAATPGFCAITGLTSFPPSLTFQATSSNSPAQTDSSGLVVASGTGNASVSVSIGTTGTLNFSCKVGNSFTPTPWITAALSSGTITGGGTVGVTITVNPCGGDQNLSGTVTISGGGFSTSIAVSLNYYEGEDVTISSQPAMPLNVTAGTDAQTYIIGISVVQDANPAPTLQFSAIPNNGPSGWLAAAKNGDPSDFSMTVDSTKLTPGEYSGVVKFTGDNGSSPFQNNVNVTVVVPAPAATISALSPASVTVGGSGFTLTVTGSGFVSGNSTIEWNGSPLTTTYVSATQLTAAISASLIASAGNSSVTVLNAGASPSNGLTFLVNAIAPVISGLSPASATAGGPAFTLTVNGSGFVAGSNVEWNGAPVATTYVNSGQLTASIPASLIAASANVSVTVLNTGGATSSGVTFSISAAGPTLLTISHIADGGGWRSSILLVNNDVVPASYTVSFHSDAGVAYTPPLASGATSGSIPVGGSTIIQTADSSTTESGGWAQVSSSQAIGGTAVFRYDPWSQEAAVPLLTSGATKLEIPYQVANGLTLGVALANPSASQNASITEIIRDLNGNQLASRTFTLSALNHSSFLPTFPATITGGGVVEYDSSINIYGLGIRSAPEGSGLAFTSLDAVLLQPASTQTISHIADGGGWRSTIILVNTAIVPAAYTVNFWNDSGAAYVPPLASGAVSGSIPVGGTTIIATADTSSTVSEGWATVTSAQTLGGTAVFRYDPWSQEAAVPLLPSGGVHLEIPYQVGNNLTLGIALANPSATQTANITEIVRDQNGNQLSTRTFTLATLDHTAFIPTYPTTVTGGGVAEYDSNITIYGLGIRSAPEGTGLAFTSVRAVYR